MSLDYLAHILVLPLNTFALLDKFLHFSVPQFRLSKIRLLVATSCDLWGLNELIHVKYVEPGVVHEKNSIQSS